MADITWPATIILPLEVEWGLNVPGAVFSNRLTGSIRTMSLPGATWVTRFAWDVLNHERSVEVEALILSLRGFTNRLVVHNLARPTPRGVGVGGNTPRVNGAGQTGASLNIDGLPASTNGIWLKGDMFSVNGELKALVAAVNSNGSGQANILFEPPLRAAPADNTTILTDKPTTRFISAKASSPWLFRQVSVSSHELVLTEDLAT